MTSNIRNSISHLVRGNYLSHGNKNALKTSGVSDVYLSLACNGYTMRKNMLERFVTNLQNHQITSNSNLKVSDQFISSLQKSLTTIMLGQNPAIQKVNWEKSCSQYTLINVPKDVSNEKLSISITQNEDNSEAKDGAKNVNKKHKLCVNSAEVGEDKMGSTSQCTLYTLLPLHSSEGKWTFAYQDFLRSRRKWWKKYFFNPSSVEVKETDPRTDTPKASIHANFEGQNFDLSNNLTLETIRMLDKDEIPNLVFECEKTEAGKASSREKLVDTFKIVEANCLISEGCIALLLDSVRKRLFLKSTRLALQRNLAPYKVAFCCADESLCTDDEKTEMKMLSTYLTLLLEREKIDVFDPKKQTDKWSKTQGEKFFNAYEAADAFGVPHLIVITPGSLKDGVVSIRDRETAWFEQIHIADIADRFVRTYCEKPDVNRLTQRLQQ